MNTSHTVSPSSHGEPKFPASVKIYTTKQFHEKYLPVSRRIFLKEGLTHARFCKAEQLSHGIAGTFAIPRKSNPAGPKFTFGYYVTSQQLIFVDDSGKVADLLKDMEDFQLTDPSSPLIFLFDFLEFLLRDDMISLLHYEERLTELEEHLLKRTSSDFNHTILSVRKELSAMSAYYEQLSDLGETFQELAAEQGMDRERLLFGLLSDKADRLRSTVQMIKEYSIQLREMHQTQIDLRQNEIMKFLTIVTTIFMPLTLVTGWYGMNFSHMPELTSPHGYLAICIVCLLILLIELWIFVIKKWFK